MLNCRWAGLHLHYSFNSSVENDNSPATNFYFFYNLYIISLYEAFSPGKHVAFNSNKPFNYVSLKNSQMQKNSDLVVPKLIRCSGQWYCSVWIEAFTCWLYVRHHLVYLDGLFFKRFWPPRLLVKRDLFFPIWPVAYWKSMSILYILNWKHREVFANKGLLHFCDYRLVCNICPVV